MHFAEGWKCFLKFLERKVAALFELLAKRFVIPFAPLGTLISSSFPAYGRRLGLLSRTLQAAFFELLTGIVATLFAVFEMWVGNLFLY